MALWGLQQLIPRAGNMTATEKALTSRETNSALGTWATEYEKCLQAVFEIFQAMRGQEFPKEGLTLNKEYNLGVVNSEEGNLLLSMKEKGILSGSATFEEFRRRGLIDESLDYDDIQAEKEKDLKNIGDIYWDANLPALLTNVNNSMEKEYVGQQESISTREKEDGAVMFLEGLESLVDLLTQYSTDEDTPQSTADKAVDQMLFGDSYFLSYDKSVLVMMAIPNFDMTDIAKVVSGTRAAQKIIDDMAKSYPDVKAGLTGFIAIGHDEMVYSEQSLGYTSIIALVAILLLLILSLH